MKTKNVNLQEQRALPAIPPEDYKGTIANWVITLAENGYEDAEDYRDIYVIESDYITILEESEAKQ
jgi:hypothetical protein